MKYAKKTTTSWKTLPIFVATTAFSTGVVNAQLVTLTGENATDGFGIAVRFAGDLDGDHMPEIVVGARDFNASAGRVYLFSGADASLLLTLDGENAGDRFGHAVSIADTNRDGRADLIVAAESFNAGAGRVYVYDGSSLDIGAGTMALLGTIDGTSPDERFGSALSGGGYLDNDLHEDFAVTGLGNAGSMHLVSGDSLTIIDSITGSAEGESLGHGVAILGDTNGDGYDDIALGVMGLNDIQGQVRVISGQTGAVLHMFDGTANNDRAGHYCARIGDIDNDGHADFAVDPYQFDGSRGRVDIRSGLSGALIHRLEGVNGGDEFGYRYAGIGDIDHDGHDDVAIAARGTSSDTGSVYVFSGATGGMLWAQSGPAADSSFGTALDAAGNVNRDGQRDLLVGAPYAFTQSSIGQVFLHEVTCGPADLAPPLGVLDFSDVVSFLTAFGAGCP